MEAKRIYRYVPSFSGAYGTGWNTMADNFFRLLLVVLVLAVISSPFFGSNAKYEFEPGDFKNIPFEMDDFFKFGALGVAAAFMGLIALLYFFLLVPVFKYGAKMMFVQAARKITPEFDMLISGFRKNYLNIVLANLLLTALIGIGMVFLFVPGIILACRLAFTPYLVMDKNLDPIRAAEESWRLTRGHGWTIFLMGLVAFFIYIAGFICLFVGVLISDMWIKSSFATLYHSVLIEKGLWQAEAVPVEDAGVSGETQSPAE
ncbi:MAG TPA: hypothetical protein PLT88_11195 [Bacteroidales bacterium]|jgi:hypothetical protein|nr:hypothetical protein [Bacteroidales bacterium]HNT93682.1 hypothetical protein [Bacteroidales bacterium]HPE23579.1 hypothetical protein [Bacteroidales bacterium]